MKTPLIGRNQAEQNRINTLVEFMGHFITQDIVFELFNNDFFCKASINQSSWAIYRSSLRPFIHGR